MVKHSSDEPANKAAERLRQFEEAREPVPADESKQKSQTPKKKEEDDKKDDELNSNQTSKNK